VNKDQQSIDVMKFQ